MSTDKSQIFEKFWFIQLIYLRLTLLRKGIIYFKLLIIKQGGMQNGI
jgi:hypothetical protein